MSGTSASPLPDDVEVVGPVSAVGAVRFVAASDTAFFWSDQTTIHRIDAGSGADAVILDRSTAGNSMQGLAVDGDTVYFGEAGIMQAFGVGTVAATGGTATSSDGTSVGSRVHGVFAPGGLAANATHLYFLSGGKQLLRIPL